ncbi:adenylyltransferase/cytidyltransferase family protein, partial [candidate division KSB1 bacterium]|nr:adenylyltransferase/cytidyltransferase family protein [candidate division KSB1 bacterium]
MQIIWNINDYESEDENVVSLGTFDGVHLGHQSILSELKEKTANRNLTATMITFEPHPQLVVNKEERPSVQILTTIEEKIQIFASLGLDRLVIAHFTLALAGMSPERFVDEILIRRLHMKKMIIGYDHAFGHSRSGNQNLLLKLGRERGFEVTVLKPVVKNSITISSTKIRTLLLTGAVKAAADLLGRFYAISGQVIPGDARGRRLGYPTLNIRTYSQYKLIPKAGIYATLTGVEGKT